MVTLMGHQMSNNKFLQGLQTVEVLPETTLKGDSNRAKERTLRLTLDNLLTLRRSTLLQANKGQVTLLNLSKELTNLWTAHFKPCTDKISQEGLMGEV
jgi:hypothetical protein